MEIRPEEIVSVLKQQIQDYDKKTETAETGVVLQAGDGIVTVYGLDNAMYGELVEFETGVRGIVLNLESGSVGCVLLGNDAGLTEGCIVKRTGRRADVPVGNAIIGRVVDALGNPIDGGGAINAIETRPIEREASGVVTRQAVDTPLQTGILAIDAMAPIGRGSAS